jgi:8-oxo-dGTP diphosphatase
MMDLPPPLIVSLLAIERDSILLVEQRGPGDPGPRWMLPGGRLEAGESLIGALAREVREETGLRLEGDPGIAFMVEVHSPGGRYSAITFTCRTSGALRPGDPDGFVSRAEWIPVPDAIDRLRAVAWYDCDPLERHLRDGRPAPVHVVDRR